MLSENARKIVESRYFLEGEETEWGQLATRVASDISNGEKLYAEPFAEMIHDMKFIPGGRILRNAGRVRGSLFNCYHLPIGDSIDEIGDCAANALKLCSDGGGVGINFCLAPSTLILKQNLIWTPIEKLQVGDKVIGFDESFNLVKSKFRPATIESIDKIVRPVYEIITNKGTVTASAEHLFVVRNGKTLHKKKGDCFQWVKTIDLKEGDEISFSSKQWEFQADYFGGWIAGIFDGEGCIGNETTKPFLSIGQNQGVVLDQIEKYLKCKNIKFNIYKNSTNNCYQIRTAGKWEAIKFLGMFRPLRGYSKSSYFWDGKLMCGKSTPPAVVQSVAYRGLEEVIGTKTSTGTLIANGFLSHNSSLRPTGSTIKGLGGRSSGLVSFMRAIDGLAACIESGGSRRAASLGSCDVSHPEIESFIDAKLVDGSISYFNISVNITKAFLETVMQGEEWPLTFRGMSYNKVDARYLWQKILSNMIASAEPGLLVWDNLIKNNSYYFAPITGCNPCGEATLAPFDVCLTGDTLLFTPEGVRKIEDVRNGDLIHSFKHYELNSKVAVQKKTGRNSVIKIIFSNQQKLKCTGNHRIYTENGWTRSDSIAPGTKVKRQLNLPVEPQFRRDPLYERSEERRL